MEKLLVKCEINQYNVHSNKEEIFYSKYGKYNTILNFTSQNIDDNSNTLSLFNNIISKEDYLNLTDKEDSLMINKKRKKQAKEENLTRKDNMQRVCKHLVIENIRKYINNKIFLVYEGKIGSGLMKKALFTINQNQKLDSHSKFNKEFLNKSIKDILSEDITARIRYYEKDHNKKVIENLIKDNKEEFENLFNLTFIECLEHFAGVKYIEELKGLKLFNEYKEYIINKYSKNDESFYYNLEAFIKDYRRKINNSNSKKSKKAEP